MLVEGVEVEYQRPDGTIAGDRVRLADFENPENNDWLAVNQFTVVEGQHNRRPDIVVFSTASPFIVIELKKPCRRECNVTGRLQPVLDLQASGTLFFYLQ